MLGQADDTHSATAKIQHMSKKKAYMSPKPSEPSPVSTKAVSAEGEADSAATQAAVLMGLLVHHGTCSLGRGRWDPMADRETLNRPPNPPLPSTEKQSRKNRHYLETTHRTALLKQEIRGRS